MSEIIKHLRHTFDTAVQATEAARLHWEGILTAEQAAAKMGIKRTNFFALLNQARQHGALETRFDPTQWFELSISLSLGQSIKEKFSGYSLEYVEVIELPPQLSGSESYNQRYDDFLHTILGQFGARHLRGITRNNDLVGIGAGLAMESVAKEAGKYRQFPSESYQVAALQGGYSANIIALQLAAALNSDQWNEQSQPVLYSVPPLRKDKPSFQPTNIIPNVAIIEIGNAPVNYWQLPEDLATLVSTLKYDCDKLQEEPNKDNHYHPLLEALGRYSVIRPSQKTLPPYLEERYSRLEYSAQALGEYTNSISWEEFRKIPKRIAVAGGLHKTWQIRHAIRIGLVNQLIVDAVTAEAILALPDSLDF